MNDTGASTTLESQRQGFRLLWIVTVLVNLAVIGLVVLVIQHNREREIAQATLLTENYSKILEQNLSGFFSKIDITLLTLRDEVVREKQQGGINDQEIRAFITRQDAHLPEALGLRVVDAQGIIRFAVKDVKIPNASIADRPQFIKMRDDPEAGLVLSKPVLGRTSGKSIITISRRINNPDGSFAGDVHVAVEINYFINQFSKINLGPNGNIGIWDKSSLIARYSLTDRNGASVGASTPSRQLHDLLNSDRSLATYHARSGIDGVSRIYSFRKMNDVPLFLLVGIADQDYLAEWQSDSLHLVALASLFVFASLVSSMLIYRNLKQREIYHQHLHSQEAEYSAKLEQSRYEAEAARQQSNLLLTSAGEGICGVDREGKLVFINPAARNMFGWAVDEGIGQSLHELTHHHYPDGRDYPMESCPIFETLRDGQWRMLKEDVYWRKDGTSFPVELTVSAIRQGEQITGAVNVFRDISERKKLEERIIHMALFDELTGLPNRSFLLDTLPRVVASSQRRQESLAFSI